MLPLLPLLPFVLLITPSPFSFPLFLPSPAFPAPCSLILLLIVDCSLLTDLPHTPSTFQHGSLGQLAQHFAE